jgi:hypothetical protein
MNIGKETVWLAEQATGGIFYIGWVSIILVAWICVSGCLQRAKIKEKGKGILWLTLPLVGIAFILLSGSILKKMEIFWWMPYLGLFILLTLLCVTVWKFKGARLFASAISSFVLWYGLWCAFVSIMSITDDWV